MLTFYSKEADGAGRRRLKRPTKSFTIGVCTFILLSLRGRMKKYLGFIDETGVLSNDPSQRFFALGIVLAENVSALNDQLRKLKNQCVSKLDLVRQEKGLPKSERDFEFKFKNITKSAVPFYYDLVELYFKFLDLKFCCLVLDKKNPQIKIDEVFSDTWSAYIGYSKLLIKNNVSSPDNVCIIADYLGKPLASEKFYENEVSQLDVVYNSCMLESHASLLIQVVDVLLGCVVLDFRKLREPEKKRDEVKESVAALVRQKLGKNSLAQNATILEPNYFSVLEFNPKPK